MAVLGRFNKQPVDVLDYQFDFTAWLADRSDTISTQTVVATAQTAGATAMTITNISRTNGIVTFFASDGADGVKYTVTCTITTTGGRTKQAEIIITVKDT